MSDLLDLAADYVFTGYKRAKENKTGEDQYNDATDKNTVPDSPDIVANEISICRKCALHSSRTNTVPGEGCLTPLVMVIGEGPGQDEDELGRPFVGKAGQLLDKMLESIGLSRSENAFIANVVKCRPPNNRDPAPEETLSCAGFLRRQILLLRPRFILVVGKVAAQALLKTTEPISKIRGKFYNLNVDGFSVPLLATYHPAALLRDQTYKRPAWEDLKLLKSKIDES